MGVFEYSVWINAAREKVWDIYVDPTRVADWQTGKPVVRDIHGAPGEVGSTYVSSRGRLAARTTVLAAEPPRELVTRTDAYFGLQLEVTSRLDGRSGGTDVQLRAETHWRHRLGPVTRLVELAILSPREATRELANLKALIEREASE